MNDQTAIKILYTLHPFQHSSSDVASRFWGAMRTLTDFQNVHWIQRLLFELCESIEPQAYEIETDLYEHWT